MFTDLTAMTVGGTVSGRGNWECGSEQERLLAPAPGTLTGERWQANIELFNYNCYTFCGVWGHIMRDLTDP